MTSVGGGGGMANADAACKHGWKYLFNKLLRKVKTFPSLSQIYSSIGLGFFNPTELKRKHTDEVHRQKEKHR